MTTRFDMENQAIQRRIALALERIAEALERMNPKETGKNEADYSSSKHSAGSRRQR